MQHADPACENIELCFVDRQSADKPFASSVLYFVGNTAVTRIGFVALQCLTRRTDDMFSKFLRAQTLWFTFVPAFPEVCLSVCPHGTSTNVLEYLRRTCRRMCRRVRTNNVSEVQVDEALLLTENHQEATLPPKSSTPSNAARAAANTSNLKLQ